MQVRNCFDLNSCNKTYYRPPIFQSCYYVEKPSCSDGIKNCHHNACEVLVDCGGSCPPCATCSDKIQNQGEEGVDCGCPCPWPCPVKKPFRIRTEILIFLGITFLILLIVIILRVLRLYKLKKGLNGKTK